MTIKQFLAIPLMLTAAGASSQVTSLFPPKEPRNIIYNYVPSDTTAVVVTEEGEEIDTAFFDDLVEETSFGPDTTEVFLPIVTTTLPTYTLRPAVFDTLRIQDSLRISTTPAIILIEDSPEIGAWLNEDAFRHDFMGRVRQNYFINHPDLVIYNEADLPEPPKHFTATVDPETARIVISEVIPEFKAKPELEVVFGKKHWLKEFNVNLQFSQAYVSPNWYQGGNNSLNALGSIFYKVKLNPAFHENLLFENTFQYKLGMMNAPDDELRDYSISEDLFQWNMTAGYKSSRRWYYSLNAQFKTQFLNNFKKGTNELKASFLSPGELNVGLGMTYNYVNPKKTVTFDASISPLSWNMKTVINKRMDAKTVHEIGSSAEGKLSWQICDNIALRSRLFVFSDYDYIQSDFENTLMFTINKFLTTQIYVHMRYDSSAGKVDDTEWRKFMLKEILSFGFTYKFNT
ncbi:MAG: DUF3078 domain-containing protein [Duncaniella sp.]|nr:DUF3078 domain-containing protein [Duncaniella sp.]MDE6171387.1 DUF3078 domain-containing protein [Duncaniella sp.]MDE6571694.1 DUF3078 domain-containing protein [Duncaniella sp.]MDE6765904.1 DUF3078 domain-containing protein [Duncaniella sp.]